MGLVGVLVLAVAVAFGLRQLRSGPDIGRLVYATQTEVVVRDLASGERHRLAGLPRDTLQAWPDAEGRWLGYLQRTGALWMLDLDSGARWRVADRLTVGQGWTPDGRFLAAELDSDRDLVAIDPGDRGTDLLIERFAGGQPAWLDDGRFATAIGDDLVLVRTEGPEADKLGDDLIPLAASPDGRDLLVSDSTRKDPRLVIATLEGDEIAGRRTVFNGQAYRAAVSGQGFVAFSGRDAANTGGTWVLESRTRRPRRVARGQAEQIAWSSDGSSLVLLIDGKVTAVDLRDDRTIRMSPGTDHVISIAVVP
ncbi:MAG: hypothetical protein ACRDKJ_04105 [Actinomycetota bacterium]